MKYPLKIVIKDEGNFFQIEDANGDMVADDGSSCGEYSEQMTIETAERMILCMNACKNIPSEALKNVVDGGMIDIYKEKIEDYKKSGEVINYMGTPIQDLTQEGLLSAVIELNTMLKNRSFI